MLKSYPVPAIVKSTSECPISTVFMENMEVLPGTANTSALLIKVFLVYSCSFVPNPLKPASSGGISSISCGTSSGTNLERGDSCSFQSVQRYLAGILKLQSLHDNQHGITGFLKANIICIIEIFLIVRPEIMHPGVFSDIGHNGLIINQE